MSGSKRISELTVTTTLSGNDRVVVLTNPASSAQTQTTTITSLTNTLRYANTTVSGVIKVGNNLSINATGFLNSNGGGQSDRLVNGEYEAILDEYGVLNFPSNTIGIGLGMGPTIVSNTSLFVYASFSDTNNNIDYYQTSLCYPNNYQIVTESSSNGVDKSVVLTLNNTDQELTIDISGNNFWSFNGNSGVLNLPNTVGDIHRDGVSVLTAPVFLAPNIAYTGVFNGYPASLPITKGQAVFFTSNSFVLETTNKYWLANRFDTNDYDLSGTETLDLKNIGGIVNNFRLGGKSETLLTDVNLHDITVVTDYFYLRDLPALATFSANNLSYVGSYFQIDSMDNANTQFSFPNLKTIKGTFYYTWNDTLENTPQFPALETINNSMYIYYNNAIQNTMTFDSLRYVDYAAIYQNAGMVAGPVFPALTSMGYLDMQNNDYMIDPPQFPVLETMTSSFYFYGHDLVTTAPALPSLTTCGYVGIYQNPVMDGGFDFSSLTNVTNTLNISENNSLTAAPAFPALVEVNGAILIENNSSLVNGFSFPSLKKVDGNVSMANCSLDETSVNYILTLLASLDGTAGTTSYDNRVVNLSGGSNAIPTGDGLTAITTLESRGCTVYYNT